MPTAAHTLPPPLREGDRLTSDEFIRRWEAMPELKHAELIDGIVYMSSRVSDEHADFHSPLIIWLGLFAADTIGCKSGPEATWRMGDRDVPQPDITLRILPEYGGQSGKKGIYAAGAPELIVEVAKTSSGRDLGDKLRLYERMRVREYIVAITGKKRLVWKVWTETGYQDLDVDSDGMFRSQCFPGLWLDPKALWNLDIKAMLAVLQEGIATSEHAEFVTRLAAAKRA